MSRINISYHRMEIGELVIGSFQEKLCILDFRYRKMRDSVDKRVKRGLDSIFLEKEDRVIQITKEQVKEYLRGERKYFDIPILMVGTDFQRTVWKELMKIPYGETCSYLDLAKRINNPKAVRAVASANGSNAIALIIPCHRVIQSDGTLGGYGGGLTVKKRLLEIESGGGLFDSSL
ncbi:MAG: cysteine methyltransferase [Candidatus Cloacimonadota bacterium]|nr:MAG: cysteine methyltransferase [Candidatus Cloacimonadota bacterium]PIE78246.1 MAG: cysteine methyltransferase [Candidatus Delongbacteria bacterium]